MKKTVQHRSNFFPSFLLPWLLGRVGKDEATSCFASYEVFLIDATMTDMATTLSEKMM
jgi:hypothetical protein